MKLFKKDKPQGRVPSQQIGRPKPAFSYYAADQPQTIKDSVKGRRSNEIKHATMSRLRIAPTLFAAVVILISVIYSTTLSSQAQIKFAGDSNTYHALSDYKYGVELALSSSFFNSSKLTINTHKTELAILKYFPELDAAHVSLPIIGRRPTVVLHARMPAMILTTSSNEYIIDMSGKIVATTKQLSSSQRDKLFTVQDQSGLELHPGAQAITAGTTAFIINVRTQLKDKKQDISQIVLPPIPNVVNFYIKDQRYYIKTDSSGDARLQAGSFLAVKDSGIRPNEYVDVRVEEKVFYK
jgi:preprotein translocase subunit SecF